MKTNRWMADAGNSALEFDQKAEELFKPYSGSRTIRLLHPLSKVADQPQLRSISTALILAGVLARSHRLARAGSRMIIAHEAATFAKDMIKTEIDRKRPRSAKGVEEKKPKKGDDTSKEMTSFPSGHSAGSIAAARAFAREFPEYGPAAIGAAVLVAALQVPRCAHYPTDVAAGLAIGIISEKAVDLGWRAAELDGSAQD